MAAPVVDVAMTTRNTASGERLDFLRAAIESVQAQTFGDWRLVVSENGAEPSAAVAEVVAPFLADPRVRHVPTRADLSGPGNTTRAVGSGSAPFVAMLHDDDWWETEFLERRVAFLREHPECGFVFGGAMIVDEHDQVLNRTRAAFGPGVHDADEYVPLLLQSEGVPQPPTALIRRAALETVGTTFEERYPAADYDVYLRLAVAFPAGYLDVYDSAFRVHSQQQTYSLRWGEQRIAKEEVIDEILERGAPHLRRPESVRTRLRARAFLSASLDAAEEGRRRRALTLARESIRLDMRSLLDPRLLATLATIVLGPRIRPLLARARATVRRRDYVLGRKYP